MKGYQLKAVVERCKERRLEDAQGRATYVIPTLHTLTIIMTSTLLFSTIEVTSQAFYRTALSYSIVNLKPIVPGRKAESQLQLEPQVESNPSYWQMFLSFQLDPFQESLISMVRVFSNV